MYVPSAIAYIGSFFGTHRQEDVVINRVVHHHKSIDVEIPEQPLAPQSLQVKVYQKTPYGNWTEENCSDSFEAFRKIAAVWKKDGTAEQYLVFGEVGGENEDFRWEIVPYYTSSTVFDRFWQQFLVLWKITFGGRALSPGQSLEQFKKYQTSLNAITLQKKVGEVVQGTDAFCKEAVIAKQQVVRGNRIHVLFNYAPIGFGSKRLHFLIVPKKHRESFNDVTQEEYQEALQFTQKCIAHFSKTRPIHNVYLFHKTGYDAGQTVKHWHMHMILTSNKTQDFFGKITVLKKMLLGARPMKNAELKEQVDKLRTELQELTPKSE